MCLNFLSVNQDDYRKILNRRVKKGWITLWKIFRMKEDNVICGTCRTAFTYNFGITKSDRRSKKISKAESLLKQINKGIHVFNSRKEAEKSWMSLVGKIAKVKVRIDDFVAGNDRQSVFMKIWLTRSEYRKLKKKLMNERKNS